MFLNKLEIENYKLFDKKFIIDKFSIPDNINIGSGLTLIVGENGCGKTTILDAIALSMLDYKGESFNISDFNDLNNQLNIFFYSDKSFKVKGTMPNSDFMSVGFHFTAKQRCKS